MVDERVLIRQSRDGDHGAFESLVGLKREKAFRIALNIVGDEDDAKDITQQAFIRLWKSLHRFKENTRFDPWFYRIVVNLAIDFYRRKKAAPRASEGAAESTQGRLPDEAVPGADSEVMRTELRRIFNRLAADLTTAQRAVFTLREIEGVTTEDIGKIMGIRPSTVRNHLHQARRILQEGLRRRYPEYVKGIGK